MVSVPVQAARGGGPIGRRSSGGGRTRLWVLLAAVLIVLALTYIPFLIVLNNSFKSSGQFIAHPFGVSLNLHFHNYVTAFKGVDEYLLNTIIVAAVSVIIGVPAGALGAYAFAKMEFRGKGVVFVGYLGLLMVPWTLTLIPLFVEIQRYQLFNTWWALVLPYAAGAQPLNLFLFRTFFEQIPDELYQSARVDGCGELAVLRRIVTPLAMPVLLTGAVLMFVDAWGDYLWPQLVLRDNGLLTASAGLESFVGTFSLGGGIGPEFAAYVIVMLPIMLLVAGMMKYFVAGTTQGALNI